MKKKTNRNIETEEQRTERLLVSDLKKIKEKILFGILSKNPTRHFAVDERVRWGAHNETYVREICEDGLYYKTESIGVQRSRSEVPHNEFHYMEWYELYKYQNNKSTNFFKEETCRIRQYNSSLDSLFHMVYHNGVDFDVEYQRDHVWTLDDKIALIDSIFNHIDIGKFVFVQRDMGHEGKLHEIIDGKQRLTALCEFYEDRFKYNGFYFSELSFQDRHVILNHSISYGYLENPDKRSIYEAFIKLNTTGRKMENKDIEKVKNLLSELDN
jgi:uncharacterized protein with ParB-like and HNH nuclease domain